jgi:hypothetical protein
VCKNLKKSSGAKGLTDLASLAISQLAVYAKGLSSLQHGNGKQDIWMFAGFMWLRIGTSGVCCDHSNERLS